mmetsp:Transcript_1547/g.3228  ORF Transcript_1547/g.3228 Transcript_1547/m.3228 type:complete len:142 (-) Transcript_1547:63-488(-)
MHFLPSFVCFFRSFRTGKERMSIDALRATPGHASHIDAGRHWKARPRLILPFFPSILPSLHVACKLSGEKEGRKEIMEGAWEGGQICPLLVLSLGGRCGEVRWGRCAPSGARSVCLFGLPGGKREGKGTEERELYGILSKR